ncbi:MAG: quinohemoprotein ethanol dehydrogenase [Pseudomonadales bacterium]|jgi:quinohemoprotein ethanol dehydrogenase
MRLLLLILSFGLVLAGCNPTENSAPQTDVTSDLIAPVDAERIINADQTPGEWLSHGRTYSEQRFSPLAKIDDKNVSQLGLAWYFDLPTKRGIETTPLIADGIMYFTGSWSMVYAMDARTGKLLWEYDPKVDRAWAKNLCCDVVNRGVALWGDKTYVGTLDGRLIALDRDTGKVAWEVETRINTTDAYSITGAPRIINGNVIIGNGGAEYSVRGYVTAYDAESGKKNWRFYTVPGNPSEGFEDDTQAMIAKTWTGEWWKNGKGGGTAWDSFAYDEKLNLLYIGVGNGANWSQQVRSPEGGENLFISSIVAVNPDTGEYVWHYQTTPGDSWDYTATQHMILAELEIDGRKRDVIMQAPKNGFFYVIDRASGELISANNYVTVTWASHIDPESGRPVETEIARAADPSKLIFPSLSGGHNWHPMSYSPATGLVYIPAKESFSAFKLDANPDKYKAEGYGLDYDTGLLFGVPDELTSEQREGIYTQAAQAQLIAWDPIKNEEVWRKQQGAYSGSGILTTRGNLIFQGNLEGKFYALAADTGNEVWSQDVQGGVMGSPVSYELDGEQYIAVVQGWGGESGLSFGVITGHLNFINVSRLLVYKLGANTALPRVEVVEQALPMPTLEQSDAEVIAQGNYIYHNHCAGCHGGNATSAGMIPDLRYSINIIAPAWKAIVIDGALEGNGMPNWSEYLDIEEMEKVKAYVVHEAKLGFERGEKRMVKK